LNKDEQPSNMAAMEGMRGGTGTVERLQPPTDPRVKDLSALLDRAREAAEARHLDRMLEALTASGFLDGLTTRLRRHWSGRVPEAEIDTCVAVAVDAAYEAVVQGKTIRNLGAWIWKAAANKICDRWDCDYQRRAPLDTDLLPAPSEDQDSHSAQLAEYRRAEAIRLARSLLPRIGQGQVVDVMAVLIDAVEHGVEDLPAGAIGETLGLSSGSVRQLLSRGLERLKRAAREAGIALPEEIPDAVADTQRDDD